MYGNSSAVTSTKLSPTLARVTGRYKIYFHSRDRITKEENVTKKFRLPCEPLYAYANTQHILKRCWT